MTKLGLFQDSTIPGIVQYGKYNIFHEEINDIISSWKNKSRKKHLIDLTPRYLKSGAPVPIYSICVPWELSLEGLRNAESQSPPQVHVLKSPNKQELWVNHTHLKVWKALVSPNLANHQNHCEELLKRWALDLAHGNSDSLSLGWI